jgi:hypothetical protein
MRDHRQITLVNRLLAGERVRLCLPGCCDCSVTLGTCVKIHFSRALRQMHQSFGSGLAKFFCRCRAMILRKNFILQACERISRAVNDRMKAHVTHSPSAWP